jgi:hypothetical protein
MVRLRFISCSLLFSLDGRRAGGMKRRLHHHMDCPGVQWAKIPFLARPSRPKMLVVPAGFEVNNATAGHGNPLPSEARQQQPPPRR